MIKQGYYFLLLFTLFHTVGFSQKKSAAVVAFYNCENFFDTLDDPNKQDEEFTPEGKYHYTGSIYHQKLHNIATVLQSMNEDAQGKIAIIGLAEIENDRVLNDLVKQEEITASGFRHIWFYGPDIRGINVAMLYNPKYFIPLHSEPLHVDLTSQGTRSKTRDVLYVYGVLAGDTVYLLVNHWPSRLGGEEKSEEKRAIAATVNRKMVDEILQKNLAAKIIIMGDLNDNPTDRSIKEVLLARETGSGTGLYNPWAKIFESGRGSAEYKDHWDLFDQIIISTSFLTAGKKHLHYANATIFKKDFMVDHYKRFTGYPRRSFAGTRWLNGYSDHFPVMMYFTH